MQTTEVKKNPPYKIVGIKADGSSIDLSEAAYPSRGWCYATATKWAIDTKHHGNPENLVRLEIRDHEDQPVPGYDNPEDSMLKVPE